VWMVEDDSVNKGKTTFPKGDFERGNTPPLPSRPGCSW